MARLAPELSATLSESFSGDVTVALRHYPPESRLVMLVRHCSDLAMMYLQRGPGPRSLREIMVNLTRIELDAL